VIDRKPHLTEQGVRNYLRHKNVYLVTNNPEHPAFQVEAPNLHVIFYPGEIDFADLFMRLRQEYGIERLTIQSGGMLNSVLLRKGLIDHVSIVIAPLLVGGQATPSLIDGESLQTEADLVNLKALKLMQCKVLEDSYLHLVYDVINETIVDPKENQ
jgi:2,5-diamino-6-(ribosylamino)-4(3H)-pyrimidinone 5'-phosphate reductase